MTTISSGLGINLFSKGIWLLNACSRGGILFVLEPIWFVGTTGLICALLGFFWLSIKKGPGKLFWLGTVEIKGLPAGGLLKFEGTFKTLTWEILRLLVGSIFTAGGFITDFIIDSGPKFDKIGLLSLDGFFWINEDLS